MHTQWVPQLTLQHHQACGKESMSHRPLLSEGLAILSASVLLMFSCLHGWDLNFNVHDSW